MSSKHIIMVVKPLRLRGSTANRAPFPSIGTGGERTFPGKWSSLTNMRNKGGPRPPSSEGRSTAPEREGDREAFNSARRAVINFGDELLRFDTPFLPAPSFPPSVMFFLQAADPSLARPPPHWQPERIETLINKTAAVPPLSPDPFPFLVMAASAFFAV